MRPDRILGLAVLALFAATPAWTQDRGRRRPVGAGQRDGERLANSAIPTSLEAGVSAPK